MKIKMLVSLALLLTLGACNSTPTKELSCTLPEGHDLNNALSASRTDLSNGCESHFGRYFDRLLAIATGDPDKNNKEKFSNFLLWANQADLLSKNQARDYYNRYFGIKYISLKGDYSVCSETCPQQSQILNDMRGELQDKEIGLAKVSDDLQSYQRANQLFREMEIVLGAACTACGSNE